MPALRISGGTLRGRRIPVPPRNVRPTSERARQAYFNIIGARIVNARFLDLFAGSGIFSFEAVSRGAAAAVAIDSSRQNIVRIGEMARSLELPVVALCGEVEPALKHLGAEPFDLVYADPPYAFEEYDALLVAIEERILPDAIVALEHRSGAAAVPAAGQARRSTLQLTRTARYGEVSISFFEVSRPLP
ncbi:MAG TPA: RsmD family RNA methyltransferase [Thermoanaerobaculia bacterium]|nr:RsmD family RNA methyltransferase [Thermoanaerobaculia bacterium]